jgi:hypothetical protein
MLCAKRKLTGEIVTAYLSSKSHGPFVCPDCRDEVILKSGRRSVNHFAHVNPLACRYADNESEEHRRCKSEIFQALQKEPHVRNVALERPLGNNRPIIPVDLRRDDWTVSYNMLRPRVGSDPNVIISNMVDSVAHVWGKSDTKETPLMARWSSNIFWALYEQALTLVEAQHLINLDDKRIRCALTENLKNTAARQAWAFGNRISLKDLDTQLSSTISRLRPFISTQVIRRMFGQIGPSLDMGEALEKGHIILVNLSPERGQISPDDAQLVGTVLLGDLWTAAQNRGKPTDGRDAKPFYVYMDEFQNFVTPTIAKNLDQAAGYGLHLTMANQYPSQVLDSGPHGKQVYNSIMANARTKVVFSLELQEDLERLARHLFMGVMSPDKIKEELFSTKVMGYAEENRTSYMRGGSSSKSSSFQRGRSGGEGIFSGLTEGGSTGGVTMNGRQEDANTWNEYDADSSGTSKMSFESEGESESESHTSSWSESRGSMLIPKMGKELMHREYDRLADQLFRAMAALHDQKQRQCVVRIVEKKIPVAVLTPTVNPTLYNERRTESFLQKQLEKWDFALPSVKAEKQIADREKKFAKQLEAGDEPKQFRHRIS